MNNNYIKKKFSNSLLFTNFQIALLFFQMEDRDNFMKIFFFPYNKIMIDKCSY